MAAAPVGAPKAGPPRSLAIILLVLGVLCAIGSVVVIVIRAADAITAPSTTAPTEITRNLGSGTWVVFERTGTVSGSDSTDVVTNNAPDLTPANVAVMGPDGPVAVRPDSANETLTRNDALYTGAVEFHAPTSGRYEVTIDTTGPRTVILTRSLGSTIRSLVPFIILGVLGGFAALLGLVLLIVGAVRRSRARMPVPVMGMPPGFATAPPGFATPPPGWYPDPDRPGQQRWWDGQRWAPSVG